MNTEATPRQLERYLGALEAALADAPVAARAEILADMRAHADDALEQGRPIDEVLAALGPVPETAAQYRSELGLPETAPVVPERGAAMLHGAAVIVGVLTGWFAAFLSSSFVPTARRHLDQLADAPSSWFAGAGPGLEVLAFVPALLAVLPLILPRRARMPVAVANAAAVAILAAISYASFGLLYVPLAVLMWAAVVVPWRVAHGLDLVRSPLWRVFGALLLALPGLLLLGGMLSGSLGFAVPSLFVALATVLLAVLFALGVRIAYALVAAVGLVVMVLAMLQVGLLALGVWWAGGAWLAIGLSALATLRPRGEGA